jgi:preprotein translocase subunit SecE
MKKLSDAIERVKTFVTEVRVEMGKCSWPTRPELFESTVVVIVSVLIIGLFVGGSDVVLMSFLRLVVR